MGWLHLNKTPHGMICLYRKVIEHEQEVMNAHALPTAALMLSATDHDHVPVLVLVAVVEEGVSGVGDAAYVVQRLVAARRIVRLNRLVEAAHRMAPEYSLGELLGEFYKRQKKFANYVDSC